MNSSTIKPLVAGLLLLFLNACAPYPHTYYPAGGGYNGYGVTQRSYYGEYPYRYDNHSYSYNRNYHYDNDHYDGYKSHPPMNNGYVRPNPPDDFSHHTDRKYKQFGYQGSVPAYPDHKNHHDLPGNNNWSKPPSDRPWEYNNNHQHGRPNSDVQNYGRNQRPDDRSNQIREQPHYDHENDKHVRYENHEQTKDQRESRRRDHYQ
jgi:hypothetical protein